MGVSMVFPNFPVADVKAATAFYTGLGFQLNPMFTSDDTSCIVVNDAVAVMIMSQERFQDFMPEGSSGVFEKQRHESTTALLLGSNDEVDELFAKVVAGGGTIVRPVQANEFGMYGGAFTDPDGHIWEAFFMVAPEA